MQKKFRLTKKEDYRVVYRHGKSTANHQFVVYYLKRPKHEHLRLGISVSKKVGNAVVRNRIRRRVKEIVRHHIDAILPRYDLVLIARIGAAEQDFHAMEKSILHVLKRAKLVNKKE